MSMVSTTKYLAIFYAAFDIRGWLTNLSQPDVMASR